MEGYIFDLDGLLMDTEILSYQLYKNVLDTYGIDFTIEQYANGYSGAPLVVNANKMIETYHLPIDFETFKKMIRDQEMDLVNKGVKIKPGVKKVLETLSLQGKKLALATSSLKYRAMVMLEQHNIQDYFDVFVFGDEVTHGKPNGEIFELAERRLGIEKDKLVVVEDSSNGVLAAYDAGIAVVCVPDMKIPEKDVLAKASACIDQIDQLLDLSLED